MSVQERYFKGSVPGLELTSFKLGGNVELWQVSKFAELEELLSYFKQKGTNWRIIGGGSNLVIDDSGISEPVIQFSRSSSFSVAGVEFSSSSIDNFLNKRFLDHRKNLSTFGAGETVEVFCGAACQLMTLSRESAAMGLSGLEFAAGIPAQLGGAVRMNAGAHGSSISEVLSRAWVLDENLNLVERGLEDLGFSYRESGLRSEEVVVAVALKFTAGDAKEIMKERKASLDYRKETQPLHLPSAGSVFKNPEGVSAGALLERNGLSGISDGEVCFSSMHCNWLVKNEAKAKAESVFRLVELAKKKVFEREGIELKSEVIFWKS